MAQRVEKVSTKFGDLLKVVEKEESITLVGHLEKVLVENVFAEKGHMEFLIREKVETMKGGKMEAGKAINHHCGH